MSATALALSDMGPVRVFLGDGSMEFHFPKGYDALKSVIKRHKGRWSPDRRCWSVPAAGDRVQEILRDAERALYDVAPSGWRKSVETYGGFACATRGYEVVVGAAGIRIAFPPGHPSPWHLKRLEGAQEIGEAVAIPARSANSPTVGEALKRAVGEDKAIFSEALEDFEGRRIVGSVPAGTLLDTFPREADRVVFASRAFVEVADPRIPKAPLHAWPYLLLSSAESEAGEVALVLQYLDADTGYRALRRRMALPVEARSPALDVVHAAAKWERVTD